MRLSAVIQRYLLALLLLGAVLPPTVSAREPDSPSISIGTRAQKSCESPLLRPLLSLARLVLKFRYQTTVRGAEVFGDNPESFLVVAEHPGLLDPPIYISNLGTKVKLRPVMKKKVANDVVIRSVTKVVRAIYIPDMDDEGRGGRAGVLAAIDEAVEALDRGENVIVYLSGKIKRAPNEKVGANSFLARVKERRPQTRTVMARMRNFYGSIFSFGYNGQSPGSGMWTQRIPKIVLSVIANAFFFIPKRKVEIELKEATDLPEGKMEMNRYVVNFFNENQLPATHVPYFWWQGSKEKMTVQPIPAATPQ
jgi:hypothetical protein